MRGILGTVFLRVRMTEATQGNAGNGAHRRRAQTSTARSRAHRARKKLEREAALQKAETERVAESLAGVAGDVASAENAVADAVPGPTEPPGRVKAGPKRGRLLRMHLPARRWNARPPRCMRLEKRNVRRVQRKRQRSNALQAALQMLQTPLRLKTPFPLPLPLMFLAFLPF